MRNSRNVAVDVGNSSVKVGVFDRDQLVDKVKVTSLDNLPEDLFGQGYHWLFSSVSGTGNLSELMEGEHFAVLDQETGLPIGLSYDTPDTLGVDRLAAAVGAWTHFPQRNVLIIDAGTCVTYDLLDAEGIFQGGVIAPGLAMRMQAMNAFTHALPDVRSDWNDHVISGPGKTTRQCLTRGAYDGLIHEIDGFITQFSKEYDELVVMMTGGDLMHFESKLKAHIFADFDLVLKGLNRILNHNQ